MTVFDEHSNFGYSIVVSPPSPEDTGTRLSVRSGEGDNFPTPPFNATVWPDREMPQKSNSTIIRITARTGDVFTFSRNQEDSNNQSIVTGNQIAATITKKTLTDIEDEINDIGTGAPFVVVGTSDADYITDGVADDVQIQAAFTTGKVFLKSGTYNLVAALNPNVSGLIIEGEDPKNTILKMGNNLNVSVFALTNEGLSNITLRNLTIDGNGANQTSGGGGFTASRINDLTMENCIFKTSYNFNVLISSGTGTALTGTLTFTNGDTTVTGSSTLFTSELVVGRILKTAGGKFCRVATIANNTSLELDRAFEYTTESGVAVTNYTGNLRTKIINCDFQGSLNTDNVGLGLLVDGLIQGNSTHDSGGGYGFGPDHCFYTKFIGNSCYNNDNDGIGMETCSYCEVVANHCYGSVSGNGIRLLSGSYRNLISDNVCRKNVNGINVTYNSTSFGTPDGNQLIGNFCELNTTHGIRIGGAAKTQVIANRCANNVTSGINVVTDISVVPDLTVIQNNYCYDSQDVKTQARGILISNGTGTVISNNHSRTTDHATAGITDSGTSSVIFNTDTGVTTLASGTGDTLRINGTGTANSLLRFQDDGVNRGELFVLNGTANLSVRSTGGSLLLGGGGTTSGGIALDADNNIGLGASSNNAAAKVQIDSTTQGFLPPRMTTTQRDAISTPPAGLMIYNTSTNKLNIFTTAWEAVTSS